MANDRQILEEKSALESFLERTGVAELELLPHLNTRSLFRLTRTNRGIHGLFEEKQLKETLLNELMPRLSHIIVNEPNDENIEKLKKILNVYPELLTRKIKKVVYQQTGQAYINYSLLQLAYAEGDDDLCCDVLTPCFEDAFGSKEAAREEIRKQLNEKFPEENEIEKEQSKAEDLEIVNHLTELLIPVLQVITTEPFNNGRDAENKLILTPITLTAIATFREALDEFYPKMIVKGGRFRLNVLQHIYSNYLVATALWWQSDHNRMALFTDGILSKALADIPQNDVMKSRQGEQNLLMQEEPFERCITVHGTNVNFYDHLRGPSSNFSSLCGSYVDIKACPTRPPTIVADNFYIYFCQLKAALFEQHMQPARVYPAAQPII